MISASQDWDWDESERGLKRALDLNPRYAPAHHAYGKLLVMTGKTDAGLAELRRAAHLDPLSPYIASDYTKYLYLAGRYDDAISAGRDSLEMAPSVLLPHRWMAAAYLAKGMGDQQQAELKLAAMPQDPERADPFELAVRETVTGNREKAFQLLEEAFAKHSEGIMALKVEPRLEPLRSDARFQSLLRRMHLG